MRLRASLVLIDVNCRQLGVCSVIHEICDKEYMRRTKLDDRYENRK